MAVFSTFSPSAMSAELIEKTFVQREQLAERLVDIFDHSARHASKNNVLLVGPRGIGKSHLVSLVYHRLKKKNDLTDKLCIAYLKEDEWGITSFLDILLRALQAVHEESGLKLPEDLTDLPTSDERRAEAQVWRCLEEALGKRTLFLIIENLDAVFRKIGERGQHQWRALMQTYPQWTVLATTPALFSGISRQLAPFYGFFEVIHLKPLSFDDAIVLLKRLADWNEDQPTAAFLETAEGRARVRAVQHLAGGNHRIFVLFYDFLSQGGSKSLTEPLLRTVDALTPYYQSQMERLSPQQQKIVNFLCEHTKPATVTTIATNCFTSHQTAAAQLKQLLANRYVRVDRLGRQAFYELTEPLLRICVEAKTHHERPLHLLVDFVRYWFSREELERKISSISEKDPGRVYFRAALEGYEAHDAHVHLSPEITPLCIALSKQQDSPEALRSKAQELAELSKIAEDWFHYSRAMVYLGRSAEALPIIERGLERDAQNIDVLRALAGVCANAGAKERAEHLIDQAINFSPHTGILFFDKGQLLAIMGRENEALDMFEQAIRLAPHLRPEATLEMARMFLRMENYEAVRKALSPLLVQGDTIRGVFLFYAIALASQEKLTEAVSYFEKATRAFADDPVAWGDKGIVLCKMRKHEEALEALDRSLALGDSQEIFVHYRCEALLITKQYDSAAKTVPSGVLSHSVFHRLLDILSSHPKQGRLQQELLALNSAHKSDAWQNAFVGGLIEFTSYAAERDTAAVANDLQTWNSAFQELFQGEKRFVVVLKLFDVLTKFKIFGDKKALLDLPREQRLLLIGEKREEDFMNSTTGGDALEMDRASK